MVWKKGMAVFVMAAFTVMQLPTTLLAKSPRDGKIVILSTTVGAEIRIDGQSFGLVPNEEPIAVAPGEPKGLSHFFSAQKRYYINSDDALCAFEKKADRNDGVPAGAEFKDGFSLGRHFPFGKKAAVVAEMDQLVLQVFICQPYAFGDILLKEVVDPVSVGQPGDGLLDQGLQYPFLHGFPT